MGEGLWVVLYVGLGWAFGTQIDVAADLAGSVLAGLGAVVVALISGRVLWRRHRRVRRQIPAV
jgi:membrane protein DedA with SNARE-associated domain